MPFHIIHDLRRERDEGMKIRVLRRKHEISLNSILFEKFLFINPHLCSKFIYSILPFEKETGGMKIFFFRVNVKVLQLSYIFGHMVGKKYFYEPFHGVITKD